MSASLHERDEDGDSDDDADETSNLRPHSPVSERRKTYDANASSIDDLRSSRELPARARRASQAYEDYSDGMMSSVLYDSGITLKKRTISLYVSLCELKSFIQLNKTGFSKALKKYDKTLDRKLRARYMDGTVNSAYTFRPETVRKVEEKIALVEQAYADVVTKGDVAAAKKELRLHLREHVVWERNTVWREMIGIERKTQAANMGIRRTLLGNDNDPSKARLQGDDPEEMATKELETPIGRVRCPTWLFSSTMFTLVGILIVFVVLLAAPIMKKPEQQNCLAMLVFVSLLWATEVRSPIHFPLCPMHLSLTASARSTTHNHQGYPPLRHLAPHPLPLRHSPCGAHRRQTARAHGSQGRDQVHLCRHVDARHHALARWLYDRGRAEQISHCQDDGDVCPEQGGHEAEDGADYQHVRGYGGEHVDQQRRGAGALL